MICGIAVLIAVFESPSRHVRHRCIPIAGTSALLPLFAG